MKDFQLKLTQIPKLPGVYIFKDNSNKIIYIGKALNLSNRVSSYFVKSNDIKTQVMVKKIEDIEYFVTNNEVEALLLENNLIKQYQPKYNIRLRDAKSYAMIKITNENLPRIIKCREKINDKDEYFGPFASVNTVRYLKKIFTDILKIRKCNKKFTPPFKYNPCLNYHIGKCSAPCASLISQEKYLESIEIARNILKGKTKKILNILKYKMQEYSLKLEYESASKIRDQIKTLEEYIAYQYIDTQSDENTDYIGLYYDFDNAVISLIQQRNGRIVGKENFVLKNIFDYNSILIDFLNAYYLNITNFPSIIFTPENIDADTLKEAINLKHKILVNIKKPILKKDKKLLILAKENAEIFFEENQYKLEKIHHLRELKKMLGLSKIPRNIEGFDIATLEGKYNIGALVNFIDGKPNLKGYRQFNIEKKEHQDDYAMIEEVVSRRYQRVKNEKLTHPDLILIDGGKAHVNTAFNILSLLGLDIPIIGLAKKNEHIYFPDKKRPLILEKNSYSLKLLQNIRDEAHRFCNTRLKKVYKKSNLKSKLLTIKGLGRKRLNIILKKFGSIELLKKASLEEISMCEGIGEDLAKKIFEYLH